MMLIVVFVVLLALTAAEIVQECPYNADFHVPMSTPSERRGFFLSEVPSVGCRGTALAWHFCYSADGEIDRNSNYSTEFGIYRPSQQQFVRYELVSNTRVQINKTGSELSSGLLYCDVVTLDQSRQFDINEGDMIGVCIFERRSSSCSDEETACGSITVSSEVAADSRLEYTSFACFNSLPNLVFLTTTLENHALHVSVRVASVNNCTIPSPTPLSIQPTIMESSESSPTWFSSETLSKPTPHFQYASTHLISEFDVETKMGFISETTSIAASLYQPVSLEFTSTIIPSETSDTSRLATSDLSQPSYSSHTQRSALYSAGHGLSTSTVTSTTSPIPSGRPFDDNTAQSNFIATAVILGITIPLGILILMLAFVMVLFFRVRKKKQNNAVQKAVLLHCGETDLKAAQPSDEVVNNKAHSKRDCEQATHSSYYEVILENALMKDDTDNSTFQYDFITHENGNLETGYSVLQHCIQHSRQKLVLNDQYSILCENYYKVLEQVSQGHQSKNPYEQPASSEQELYAQFHKYKLKRIPRKDILVTKCLGCGQFGRVHKGVYMWKTHKQNSLNVAVKTLGLGASLEDRIKLLQEAAIMGQFLHPNTIQLLGVVISEAMVMLVMELASKGDLKNYLLSMNPGNNQITALETPRILLSFSHQTAFGMQYLASKGFVHRDLAARNILLSDGNICKIADFGMSRDLANEEYYTLQGGAKIPLKWTAPESIHYRKYSTASDVWSYGCLLYEIWSIGKIPFQKCSHNEVVEKLDSGYRLPPPPGCPRAIYQFMISCWNPNTSSRIGFGDILIQMMAPPENLLEIPDDALKCHKLAGQLGAPIEAGKNMYSDLQQTYKTQENHLLIPL